MDADGPLRVVPADVHDEDGRQLGALLVLGVLLLDDDAVPGEALRPVALLARLAGRAEVVDGRRDRLGVGLEGDREDLARAGELGFHEPGGAFADVALDAADAGVRRAAVGRELRGHHGVAGLAAELDGVHHLQPLVGGEADDRRVQEGRGDDERRDAADLRRPEVDRRGRLGGPAGLLVTPPLQDVARGNQEEPGHEEAGQDQEKDDPGVGMPVPAAKKLDHPEEHHRDSGRRRDDDTRLAEPVLSEDPENRPPPEGESLPRSRHLVSPPPP